MKKDTFIDCGYMMLSVRDEYYDKLQEAEKEYLAKLTAIEKQHRAKIFTEQAIEEAKYGLRFYETNLIVDIYTSTDANIYSEIVNTFVGMHEDKFGITLY